MARVSEGRFSAEEITEAYAAMHARVQGYVATGDWDGFADNFTEDAEYVEHAFGTFRGRDEIRAWSVRTMTTFPGGIMTGFPLAWQVVDAPTSRLICEVRNLMPDPGDGSHARGAEHHDHDLRRRRAVLAARRTSTTRCGSRGWR